MRHLILAASTLLFTASLAAQSFTTGPCTDGSWHDDTSSRHRFCETRHTTLPLVGGHLSATTRSGGITVIGEDRTDIVLDAKVEAHALTLDEATSLVHQIQIHTTGTIEAEAPRSFILPPRNWSVSFTLHVPRHLAATLRADNGGIHLSNLEGTITADTTNGGVTLSNLAGDVRATTTNGGVKVELAGEQWKGHGLVAHSTNGGVTVLCSDRYSAHVIAQTTNGRVRIGFPSNIQSDSRTHLEADLGHGGPTLDLATTNGGVHIDRN